MSAPELTLDAGALKALRKDPEYDGGPVILQGAGEGGDPASVLAAIERLRAPVIFVASGKLDAARLALCCACVATYIESGAEVGPVDSAEALALGLAGRLTDRVGPAGATRLLLDPSQPSAIGNPQGDKGQRVAAAASLGLVRVSDDPLGDARALAARLADPAARLLHRSLTFAARSTPSQAAGYDTELLHLLDPQTDR